MDEETRRKYVEILQRIEERKRKQNSNRIKAGMAYAKRCGVQLGNPNLAAVRCTDTSKANAARQMNAALRNANLLAVIHDIERNAGKSLSLTELASRLNAAGHQTARGKLFTPIQVSRIKASAPAPESTRERLRALYGIGKQSQDTGSISG